MNTCRMHGEFGSVVYRTPRCPMCALVEENNFLRDEIRRMQNPKESAMVQIPVGYHLGEVGGVN